MLILENGFHNIIIQWERERLWLEIESLFLKTELLDFPDCPKLILILVTLKKFEMLHL